MRLSWTLGARPTALALSLILAALTSAPRALAADSAKIDFDHPGAGSPAVEVDIPAELLGSVVGLGDAAIAGVAEGLIKGAGDAAANDEVKLASDQLAAIRQVVDTVKGAVTEVRIRVYRDAASAESQSTDVGKHYSDKLANSAWKQIVRVREDGQTATVFVMQENGAIRGVFVVAGEGSELVLANVICDVSPERVKQLTEQATTMGIKFGGKEALEQILRDINQHHHHQPIR